MNEIVALATRAARGGGAPPAQAARFGRAVPHHLAASHPEEALIVALLALPAGPILTLALDPAGDAPLAHSYRATSTLPERLTPSARLLEVLSELAHRTYVPASEASRTSGAGAGLSDND